MLNKMRTVETKIDLHIIFWKFDQWKSTKIIQMWKSETNYYCNKNNISDYFIYA